MKTLIKLSWIAFLAFFVSSCDFMGGERVRGNGNVVSEVHDIKDFSGVSVGGAIELYITIGSSFEVRVETDENLQSLLEVYRDGSILRISPVDHVNPDPTDAIKVFVTAPAYSLLKASGACKITSEGKLSTTDMMLDLSGASDADLDIEAANLRMELSGASTVALTGAAQKMSVDGSGASHVKAADFTAQDVSVQLSGASSLDVHAAARLDADLSGASNVTYSGNPELKTNTSGASSVRTR